jgi:ribosomal protein L11 methyltransferase
MNQPYLELKIVMPEKYQEFLIAELTELDFEGFEQEDEFILAFIPASRLDDAAREHIERILSGFDGAWIETEIIHQPRNWNEEWEGTIQPMVIGSFYIKPTWSLIQAPPDKIVLEIDPKMSFGTGYHETTRLMLQLIDTTEFSDASVLDAGTGTGILAIAAIKKGATKAVGFDIDEWSYQNALENSMLNRVNDRFQVIFGTLSMIDVKKLFDIVMANINRNTLLDIAEDLAGRVKPGGSLFLSGLLMNDVDVILENRYFGSFVKEREIAEGEWVALKLKKTG